MAAEKIVDFAKQYGVWYGTTLIEFNVVRRARKTLEIAVLPDSRVEVTAPEESTEEAIREKVKKRAAWIIKQRNWFKQFDPRTPVRQYLGGETHLYLGKRYRLKISEGEQNSARLIGGFFHVAVKGPILTETVQKLVQQWYRKQAERVFTALFDQQCSQYEIESIPKLQIKSMKTRWGSLSEGGILTLNSSLVQAPKECINYVIIHELCHLVHHNHSPEFYKLLSTRLPDWEKQKQKLEEALI